MFYVSTITTTSGTAPGAPKSTILQATSGVVVRSEFYFPPGPSGLVGIQVRVANVQIFPMDRDEWVIGDNLNIIIDDLYELNTPPRQLEIRTYNVDTQYDHLIQFRTTIMSIETFSALHGQGISTDELKGILDTITMETKLRSERSRVDAFKVMGNADINN